VTLLICRTCPRYDMRATGTFGAVMSAAVAASGVAVRGVQCLGGCPEHGVVAVDGPGKTRVRFTGLDVGDADAVVRAARAHDASASGSPGDWVVPVELMERISAVTYKRLPL